MSTDFFGNSNKEEQLAEEFVERLSENIQHNVAEQLEGVLKEVRDAISGELEPLKRRIEHLESIAQSKLEQVNENQTHKNSREDKRSN